MSALEEIEKKSISASEMTDIEYCIYFVAQQGVMSRDNAKSAAAELAALIAERDGLREQLRKAVIYWDNGSPNFNTNTVEFPFEVANEINHFMNDVRRQALKATK
jgi:uncharacterized protein (DUF2267 family)